MPHYERFKKFNVVQVGEAARRRIEEKEKQTERQTEEKKREGKENEEE